MPTPEELEAELEYAATLVALLPTYLQAAYTDDISAWERLVGGLADMSEAELQYTVNIYADNIAKLINDIEKYAAPYIEALTAAQEQGYTSFSSSQTTAYDEIVDLIEEDVEEISTSVEDLYPEYEADVEQGPGLIDETFIEEAWPEADGLEGTLNDILSYVLSPLTDIVDLLTGVPTSITEVVTGGMGGILEGLAASLAPLLEPLVQGFGLLISPFWSTWKNALGAIFPPLARVGDAVSAVEQVSVSQETGSPEWLKILPFDIGEQQARAFLGALLGAPMGFFPFINDSYRGGMGEIVIQNAAKAFRPTLATWREYLSAYHREEISDSEYEELMLRLGTEPTTQKVLERLFWLIPTPQDLIRMAVREVFTPDIVAKFGQMEDFPEDFKTWAEKIGISEEWARNYWAAHWDLPGAAQGFEMLHRGVISQEELELLLRALDVMPFWRERLTKISYRVLTRVDVRRMYRVGVLDRDGVKDAYLKLGYDEKDAEDMTEFTIRYETGGDRDLSRADVLSGYRTGLVTRDQALEYIQELGYSEDEAEFYVSKEELSRATEVRELTVSTYKQLYTLGVIDRTETVGALADRGFSVEEIALQIELWDLLKEPKVKQPTRSELTHFWGIGVIDDDTFISEMATIGYAQKYINWYFQERIFDEIEAAQKEEERARQEAERVEAAAVKTAYEESRAQIDVDAALAKTYIAEKKLAILRAETDEEKAAYNEDIATARVYLADLARQKAELKLG